MGRRIHSGADGVQSGFSDFPPRALLRFDKTGRFFGQSNSNSLDI